MGSEDVFYFSQRLLAEVRGFKKLGLGALNQVTDVIDALGLEAVGRTHREFKIIYRTKQDGIDLNLLFLRLFLGRTLHGDKHGKLLLENAGRVLTRDTLIDRVWGSDYVGDTKTLDVHIKRLRSKVEPDPTNPSRIVTIRGLGYKYATP